MSSNMPDPQRSRKSRLDLLKERVGKDPEPTPSSSSVPSELPSPTAPTAPPQPAVQPPLPSQAMIQQGRPMPIVAPNGDILMPTSRTIGQPSSHDRRSEVSFEMRNKKDNVQVDKRLWPAYAHYMSHVGRSKVDAFNRMVLKALLDAGYQIDPNILDKPFTYEDLPK